MTTPRSELSGHPASLPARPGLHEPGSYPARLPILPPFPRQPARLRPLPDVVAVRRLPLPDSAPPYDDQPADPVLTGPAVPSHPQARPGPVSRWKAGPEQTDPRKARPDQACGAEAHPEQADLRKARLEPASPAEAHPKQPGPAGARPERASPEANRPRPGQEPGLAGVPGAWPSQFAQALAEALAGARPQQQLTSWTTQRARSRIRQLGPLLQAGPRPRVRRVVGCAPAGDIVELAVILSVGPAVRALAVRLERTGQLLPGQEPPRQRPPGQAPPAQTWLCTDIEAA